MKSNGECPRPFDNLIVTFDAVNTTNADTGSCRYIATCRYSRTARHALRVIGIWDLRKPLSGIRLQMSWLSKSWREHLIKFTHESKFSANWEANPHFFVFVPCYFLAPFCLFDGFKRTRGLSKVHYVKRIPSPRFPNRIS